jgi:hypothetical protein
MWFFFEQQTVPASCIDKIKSVFKAVAKSIVDLDEFSSTETKFLANNVIESDSTSHMMVAALSSASRFVDLSSLFRFYVLIAAKISVASVSK